MRQRRSGCNERQEDICMLEFSAVIFRHLIVNFYANWPAFKITWNAGLAKVESVWRSVIASWLSSRVPVQDLGLAKGEREPPAREKPFCWGHHSKIHSKSCRWERLVAARVENILQKVFDNPQDGTIVDGNSIYDLHPENLLVILGWGCLSLEENVVVSHLLNCPVISCSRGLNGRMGFWAVVSCK